MKVSTFNGCKVYNLSSGKAVPQFLSESKKRALAKDEEYRKRLDLIQDFEMTTAAQCIRMTKDGEHIIVTGTYPPLVRCYTTSDMAMKFQRGLTCEVVAMETLSDDFGKMVFLQADRTLNFHAPYGTHYSVRVPKFGRDMLYNWDTCDLCVSSSGDEVYRLNLESGQFKEPFTLGFSGCNKISLNPAHQLLACGGEKGICEFWDPREKASIAKIFVDQSGLVDITALQFDIDGLSLAVGTSNGNCLLYDIRSKVPLFTKEHQYGLPIVNLAFHNNSRTIISSDKKLVKIWERDEPQRGQIVTNVETSADINDVLVVSDRRGQSGLIMVAGEQSRIMSYFIPQLGPAPRWCSFLEGLTEELEESTGQTVYEDFKFLTRPEVDAIGAGSLIGTPMLKAYMHGFFIEIKLYNKLRAVTNPMEYEEYRKKKISDKIAEKTQSRIAPKRRLPKVNSELAEKIMHKSDKEVDIDPRFSSLFVREEFQQDPESIDFKLRNPTTSTGAPRRDRRADSEDDELRDDNDGIFLPVPGFSSSNGGNAKNNRYAATNRSDDDYDEEEDDYDDDDGNGGARSDNDSGHDSGSENELDLFTHRKPKDFSKGKPQARSGDNNKDGAHKKRGHDDDGGDELGPIERLTRRLAQKAADRQLHMAGVAGRSSRGDGGGGDKRRGVVAAGADGGNERDRLRYLRQRSGVHQQRQSQVVNASKRMYELAPGVAPSSASFAHSATARRQRSADQQIASVPLKDRAAAAAVSGKSRNGRTGDDVHGGSNKVRLLRTAEDGLVREFSYVPDERKAGSNGGGGGRRDKEREQMADTFHSTSTAMKKGGNSSSNSNSSRGGSGAQQNKKRRK